MTKKPVILAHVRSRLLATLLLLPACGTGSTPGPGARPQASSAPASATAPIPPAGAVPTSSAGADPLESPCVHYVYKVLYGSSSSGDDARAMADAQRAYDGATDAAETGDHRKAAQSFLACARHYRSVPEQHRQRQTADQNARICYYNAMYAFANAGELSSRGNAVFERASSEDPRQSAYIHELSKDPPTDCDAPRVK